uniref:Terpene cyclase/mutase family member n=1 Tax=Kalanchoe fedtschenkoi TaxID=63787 RepID=A0A7N0V7D5_KALFE
MWTLKLSKGQEPWVTSVNNHVGRQHWEYDSSLGTPEEIARIDEVRQGFHKTRFQTKHSSDLIMRLQFQRSNNQSQGNLLVEEEENEVKRTLRKALRFYSALQADDGFWPGDYGGPLFLLPGLIIGLYVTRSLNVALSKEHQKEIMRYLYNHQVCDWYYFSRKNEDGGWGLHIEGHSTMFGTALTYVTLRLLGEGLNDEMQKAQKWILDRGGVVSIPSWGKFWLSVLGLYEWSGNNPLPPELWLLPRALPLHPGRMWCHARMVYLPMSYLYGKRFVTSLNSLVLSLRQELYATPYHSTDWDTARNSCAKEDLYYPHPVIQDILWGGLHKIAEPILKQWPFSKLRQRALSVAKKHLEYEDESTNYICIGPVNKALNMVCCWIDDPNSQAFSRHLARVKDYLWLAEDGMKMQGYNGSQTWDASFAVQAILSTNLSDEYGTMLKKAHNFIKNTQVRENSSGDLDQWYRHSSKGGWTFSTPDNGWTVSDCTGEALQAVLQLSRCPSTIAGEAMTADKLYDAVHLLLSMQNQNGGFATYELTRSYAWLEMINPAETFGDIIIDYQYVECTSAVIQSLNSFMKSYPGYRKKEITACIAKAADYIENIQLPDGSWYGSWGVCFTYATWYAIKGLIASGRTYQNSYSIRRACDFLLSKELEHGGWGESYLSCQNKVYTNLEGNRPHIVNTAWAMLALIAAGVASIDPTPLHKGAKILVQSQCDNGDFPQQEIIGVFNRNCMISYSAYRNIFPIWALGEYYNCVLLQTK